MSMSEQSTSAPSDEQYQVEYRDIPGFPGYLAGDDGSIWTAWIRRPCSAERGGFAMSISDRWKRLKQSTEKKSGYLCVKLRKDGRNHNFRVHSLIVRTFLAPLVRGQITHHRDRDKKNNRLNNLEVKNLDQHSSEHHRIRSDLRGLDEPNELILCSCGCGRSLLRYDKNRRPRSCLWGHNGTGLSDFTKAVRDAVIAGKTIIRDILASFPGQEAAVHQALFRLKKRGDLIRLGYGKWAVGECYDRQK